MSQTRLSYLLQRFFENNATPEEVDEVMLALEAGDNEAEVKMVMDHLWKDHAATEPVFSSEKSNLMLADVLTSHTFRARPVEKRKKIWLYAAAVIILLGSAAIYKIAFNNNTGSNTAKTESFNKDAAPGGYKALLTLADKSTIVLDSIENGVLTQQGNTKIMKQGKGQIAYIPSSEKQGEILFNSITTPRGGEYEVLLSDGSFARLNAASSLRFPATFEGKERRVEITGEVYFEVAKNASKPFVVNVAGKGEVKVLGTHFNINAYSDEASVKTTLLEGSVQVTTIPEQASGVISPGEQAEFSDDGQLSIHKNVNTEQVLAWKNGIFSFSNADLLTILRQLSRWYDVDITFEGSVPDKKFQGELQKDLNLSQVLRLLEKNNVHFRIEGKKLVVL